MTDIQLKVDAKTTALLKAGDGRYPKIPEFKVLQAIALLDRTQAMTALRTLGFSYEEIGIYYGVSRQRVEQLVPSGGRAAAKNTEEIEPDVLMMEIWLEASNDLSWWGPGGRLVKARIVDTFHGRGFTWKRARDIAREVSISKIDVILRCTFDVSLAHEDKITWFKEQIETLSKAEIFRLINAGQPLQVPYHTFVRVWREFGLQVKVRKTRKQMSA